MYFDAKLYPLPKVFIAIILLIKIWSYHLLNQKLFSIISITTIVCQITFPFIIMFHFQSINEIIDFYNHKIFIESLHSVLTADSAPVQPAGSKNLIFTDSYFIKRRPLFRSSCLYDMILIVVKNGTHSERIYIVSQKCR